LQQNECISTHVASLDFDCRALGEGQRLPWVMVNVLVSIIGDWLPMTSVRKDQVKWGRCRVMCRGLGTNSVAQCHISAVSHHIT